MPTGRNHLPLPEGQRFGHLTVLGPAAHLTRRPAYRFLCDCGTEKVIRAASVRSGASRSCGCLQGAMLDRIAREAKCARQERRRRR
jgi:hypothetical protein